MPRHGISHICVWEERGRNARGDIVYAVCVGGGRCVVRQATFDIDEWYRMVSSGYTRRLPSETETETER